MIVSTPSFHSKTRSTQPPVSPVLFYAVAYICVLRKICTRHHWYANPDPSISYKGGASLGNSWRIAGDGQNWPDLTQCMNTQADVADYNAPGGWSDPDLLVGTCMCVHVCACVRVCMCACS